LGDSLTETLSNPQKLLSLLNREEKAFTFRGGLTFVKTNFYYRERIPRYSICRDNSRRQQHNGKKEERGLYGKDGSWLFQPIN